MKYIANELEKSVLAIIRKQAQAVLKSSDFCLEKIPKRKESERRIVECEKRIQHWSERRQQYYEQFVLGEMDGDAFKELKSKCTIQINQLNNQLAIFKQSERDKAATAKAVEIAKTALSETATPQDIVNALVNKILVFPNNEITIEWKFVNFTV